MRRPLLALLLLASAAGASGCLQAEETIVLMPDGSGKITLSISIKKSALTYLESKARSAGAKTPNPFDQFSSPESGLVRNSEGVVAWTLNRPETSGEWVRASMTGYFEDINRVRIFTEEPGPEGPVKILTFQARLAKTPSGWSLLSSNEKRKDLPKLLSPDRAGAAEQSAAMDLMKPMLQDMKYASGVTVPGAIKDAVGFMAVDGRRASSLIDGGTLVAALTNPQGDEHRKLKQFGSTSDIRLSWASVDVSETEVAGFKDEMARAVAAWGGRPAPKLSAPLPDASKMTDDEVNRLFIQAQIKAARELLRGGKKDKAKAALESVVQEYPNEKATLEARTLLDSIR